MLSRSFLSSSDKRFTWRPWVALIALGLLFALSQLFLSRRMTNEKCDSVKWSNWGPWSKCEMTPGGECIKGRFRSCFCSTYGVPSETCHNLFGGETLHWDYCNKDDCFEKPPSRISVHVPVPGAPKKLYMMEVPAYGPNNQYLGMKEAMIITKYSGRTFARPDFWPHMGAMTGDNTRKFEATFDTDIINEYLPTISMKDFSEICNHQVDLLVWLRWKYDHWIPVINSYFSPYNLSYKDEWLVPTNYSREEQPFRSFEEITKFFSVYEDKKCIALIIPFRNLWFDTPERVGVAKFVHHAAQIRSLALEALKEIQVSQESLIAYHWRFGEDSCERYKVPGKDFCYGTSVFTWVKMEDALFVLKEVMKEAGNINHLYLAISATFNPKEMLQKLKEGLSAVNIAISTSSDIKVLKSIEDPYILSLVEQEICALAKVFIASTDSTWSDFVVDYISANGLNHSVHSFTEMLKKHNKDYKEMNLMHVRNEGQKNSS